MAPIGGLESEVKLRVEDPAAARERLTRAGAVRVRARHFEDNRLFDDGNGSLARAGTVLRLRRTRVTEGAPAAEEAQLTFKGPRCDNGGVRTREEIELHVPAPDALEALLERLGYRPRFRYQKYRETWRLGALEVVVDETPIGCFLEIEGAPEAIPEGARALGFERGDFILESYVALFFEGGGQGDMVFA